MEAHPSAKNRIDFGLSNRFSGRARLIDQKSLS